MRISTDAHPRVVPRRVLRGARGGLGLVGALIVCLMAPGTSEADWEPYGEVHAGAGEAGNARLLDPNAPASARGGQVDGTLLLMAGVRAGWQRSALEVSYTPSGEFFEDSSLSRVSQSLAASWKHDGTRRLSFRLTASFNETPDLAVNPTGIQQNHLPVGGSGTIAGDLGGALEFRLSGRTTLIWSFSDERRLFSADQFVDSSSESVEFEYRRALSPHNSLVSGYDYGVFSFADGTGLRGSGGTDPNVVFDPNSPPPTCDPTKDPNCPPVCGILPLDPNCLLPLSAGGSPRAAAAARGAVPASGLGTVRHRSYVGYLFDRARGFHVDVRAGYDLLVFDDALLGSVSSPYLQSSAGWRWSRVSALLAYRQGLDEGGGLFTNAMTRDGRIDLRMRLAERISLDLGAGEMTRDALARAGGPAAAGRLRTSLGTATLDFILSRSWSLEATYVVYVQRSSGLVESVPDVMTSRISFGVTWGFGPRRVALPDERS